MRKLDRLTALWNGDGPNLNAGCGLPGTCIGKSFINLDIIEYDSWKTRPNLKYVIGDARDLQYSDNYFWVIFTSEMMEHFSYSDSVKVLMEFYRVLKPDGGLKICCPDFKFAVDVYLGRAEIDCKDYDMTGGLLGKKDGKPVGNNSMIWSVLYGHYRKTENNETWPEHQTVWDEELLKYWLERIGFKDVERVYDKLPWNYPSCNARDLCMEAWK